MDELTTTGKQWELAEKLAKSELLPAHLRNKPAEVMIAVDMAQRTGMAPMAVAQNIYVVHGKPAWSSQFLIACVNASGVLRGRLQWEVNKADRSVVAWGVDQEGNKLEGPAVTIDMAKAEGWVSKNGSKWKTMPELMLRYRAATFFARLYCPELTMGLRTVDELEDINASSRPMRNITPTDTQEAEPETDPTKGGVE